MKTFVLAINAYHRLENIHEVSISETGNLSRLDSPSARFLIKLDLVRKCWIYARYLKTKDSIGCYLIGKKWSMCRVLPDFVPAYKYNR